MSTKKKTQVPADLLPASPVEAAAVDMSIRTVGGKPIPEHLAHLIPYANTDQGMAEREARPGDRARCSVGAEGFEKELMRMEDEPFLESDPFKEKVESLKAGNPGMRFKMLSKKVLERRGKRGFEILKDKKGDPESVGGMLVGVMPERTAQRRNAKFQAIGNEAIKEQSEAYEAQQEKIIRDAKGGGLSVLPAGEMIQDSRNPNRVAESGLHQQRG